MIIRGKKGLKLFLLVHLLVVCSQLGITETGRERGCGIAIYYVSIGNRMLQYR